MQHDQHSFTLPTHPTIRPLTWNGATTFVDAHRASKGKKAVVVAGTGHREKDFPRLDLTVFSLNMTPEAVSQHLNSKGAEHDPMWLWNAATWADMVDHTARHLKRNRATLVKTGMALGWDVLLAAAALKAGIPYVAYLPFESQAHAWPKAQQKQWAHLVANAAAVVLVTPDSQIDQLDGTLTKDGVIQALYKRNFALVHNLTGTHDYVFSLDKGKSSGGTRHCVQIAESLNLKIVNFWEEFETCVALPNVATLQLPHLGKRPQYTANGEFYEVEMVPLQNTLSESFRHEMGRIKRFWKGTALRPLAPVPPTALETAAAQLGF